MIHFPPRVRFRSGTKSIYIQIYYEIIVNFLFLKNEILIVLIGSSKIIVLRITKGLDLVMGFNKIFG